MGSKCILNKYHLNFKIDELKNLKNYICVLKLHLTDYKN